MPRKLGEPVQGPDVHLDIPIERALRRLERHVPQSISLAPYDKIDIFRPVQMHEIDDRIQADRENSLPPSTPDLPHEERAFHRVAFCIDRISRNLSHAVEVARDHNEHANGDIHRRRTLDARRYIAAVLDEFLPRFRTAMVHIGKAMRDPELLQVAANTWEVEYGAYRPGPVAE